MDKEMDGMRIRFSTKFMRSIISKVIRKKFGFDLTINSIEIEHSDHKIHFRADAEMDSADFIKALKTGGLL